MHDWGYETEPEPNLNGRRIEAMRGKVLGGSSSINVMAYTRGNRGDYDRWAQKGARGWSYADVLPYFKRAETWENGANTWRGGDGPLGTQCAKTPDPIFDAWLEAARSRPAIRSPRTTTASSRKASAAASTPSATAGARRRRAPICVRPRGRHDLTVETGAHATRVHDAGHARDRRRIRQGRGDLKRAEARAR